MTPSLTPRSMPTSDWLHTLRLLLEIAATAAFALSGMMIAAARKRLDAVGVCVVAFVAAFGGGTLRDLLLDQRPFFWVRHTEFVWGILALCVAAMLFMRQRHFEPTERAMLLPDAIGLGLFAAVGVDVATAVGMPAIIGVMMGVITGRVWRRAARRAVQRSAPGLQRPPPLRTVRLCRRLGRRGAAPGAGTSDWMPRWWPAWLVTAGLRGLALWRNWQLPAWRV
jgi:uncharacterized membrane protein YeiH